MTCLNPQCGGELSQGYVGTTTNPDLKPAGYDVLLLSFRRCNACGLMHSSSGKKVFIRDGVPMYVNEDDLAGAGALQKPG